MFLFKVSMLKKIILSTIPIFVGALSVSWTVEQMAKENDGEFSKAIEMTNLVSQAELEMVKMSEALRGYLLTPENENEYKRKMEADKAYSAISDKLSELVKENQEILFLNEKMAKYDETDLDQVENKVARLIQSKDPGALQFYTTTYMPARQFQTENFQKLKELVTQYSHQIVAKYDEKKVSNAHFTVALLMSSIVFGLCILIWVSQSVVRKIQEISHHIRSNVVEVDGVANSMAASSRQLSEASTTQAASLQETAASLEQITSMVAKAADSAQKSAESSAVTQERAIAGKESMTAMLAAIDDISGGNQEIAEQFKNSNEQMSQIVHVITEIGNKTQVINEIVFQTKLLSFNASVEAARAGEHGKGFAVVAAEVGSLAQMSGNAAKEISDMLADSTGKVQEILRDSQARVQSLMDRAQSKVDRGVEVAKQCSESLDEIVQNVERVSGLAQEISHASREQSTGLNEIAKAMSQLDASTQVNASTSESTARGAQSLTQQTESLRDASQELTNAIMGQAASSLTSPAGGVESSEITKSSFNANSFDNSRAA